MEAKKQKTTTKSDPSAIVVECARKKLGPCNYDDYDCTHARREGCYTHFQQPLELLRAALWIRERFFGRRDKKVGDIYVLLGNLHAISDRKLARKFWEQALSIYEGVPGLVDGRDALNRGVTDDQAISELNRLANN